MNTTASSLRNSAPIPLIAVLALLAGVVLWFVVPRYHYFSDFSVESYSDYYWPRRGALIPHLLGGSIALTAGLVQIWLGLTRRTGVPHRLLGRIYGTGVLLASAGGIYLALTIPEHIAYSAGLVGLDAAWLTTTGMAIYAVRRRIIEQHRDWMLRSYTVTFAFVTFRLVDQWLHGWIKVPEDNVADGLDTLMAWACWSIPLLIAEPLIQLRHMRRRRS
jgi:hypothetical protein